MSFSDIMDKYVNNQQFAIGVSGGCDSMALMHLSIEWIHNRNYTTIPHVLSVNHNLRDEARDEVEFVKQNADHCYHHTLEWQHSKINSNIQALAREARYRIMTKWCIENHVKILLIAHHLDDQAETVMLRLARGSGIDGLSAMTIVTKLNDIKIVRPLLNESRENILNYLNKRGLNWAEDPSNAKYERSIYRRYLNSSRNPELLKARLCRTAEHMQNARDALSYYTNQAIDNCIIYQEFGYIEILHDIFFALPKEISMRVLLHALTRISGKIYKPRYNKFINLFNKIWNKELIKNYTLHGCVIQMQHNIVILRELSAISDSITIKNAGSYLWDNRFICTINCSNTVYLTKLGINGLQDIQNIDNKLLALNKYILYTLPALKTEKGVVSCPHINYNSVYCTIKCIINRKLNEENN